MAVERLVKQEGAKNPQQYRRRVKLLAAIYLAIGVLTLLSMFLIAWQVKFFTTFSQRTNIETLTFALIFVLFAYLFVTTAHGFIGALRLLWYNGIRRLFGGKDGAVERAKHAALTHTKIGEGVKRAYTDVQILKSGAVQEPMTIILEDDYGKMGDLQINGVRLKLNPQKHRISNSVFEYIASQIEDVVGKCPDKHNSDPEEATDVAGDNSKIEVNIVQWQEIDEDQALAYYHQVEAFRRLARKMDSEGQFWPSIILHDSDVQELTKRMRQIVPSIRDECFLPDVEYSAEYKVPILPEPLGFISLNRSESRADPVATMGCAALIALTVTALLLYLVFFPTWVPGK